MGSQTNPLEISLSQWRGVGPERMAQLERLGLRTVGDALMHRPSRYEDRRNFQRVAALKVGQPALVVGRIIAAGIKRTRTTTLFEFILDDGSGRLYCRWWNQPYMEDNFKTGDELVVFGKPGSLRPRCMDNPETEIVESLERSIHLNRIVPVYPLTEGLSQRWLRRVTWELLGEFEKNIAEPYPEFPLPGQPIPGARQPTVFPTRARAVRMLHFPESADDAESARLRLAMDEFITLQLSIQTRRKKLETNARSMPCAGDNRLIKPLLASLGFQLTEAQTRVLREIRRDMAGPRPMRRLLQGDVGSGKTVVAACAALMALESGANAALMAPTELLAEQHWRTFRRWFEPLQIRVELRAGGATSSSGNGSSTLFIGTHALLEASFAPERLGLVIIDEQHKFGVGQREELLRKGDYPHLLVMTATPIPRTLGLTLYGDLDVSVIDQIPAGRGRVKTYVRTVEALPKVWEFMREQISKGRQGYVVYSRLDDADPAAGLKAVTREFHNLEKIFTPAKTGFIHGKMAMEEREKTMAEFLAGRLHVLMATSVIEVGVDVSNATIMVVENAEQFGLAQLHQLRGRIGRGAGDSHCILISSARGAEAAKRLKMLKETTDGFRIAEMDLQLRGPGELPGRRQSGEAPFVFGNLAADVALIERAREMVKDFLKLK